MDIMSGEDFLKLELKGDVWLVPDMIPGTGLLLVQAHPKVGKSLFTMQLAQCLEAGLPFLGHPTVGKRRVLYVQCDEPTKEWQEQMKMIKAAMGWEKILWDTWWTEPNLIADNQRVEKLRKNIREKGYGLVVYDSFIKASGWVNLDDPKVAAYALRQLEPKIEIPWLLNHHKRKGMAGIPDRADSAGAGSYNTAGTASAIIDLLPKKIKILGRLVYFEEDFERGKVGQWFPVVKKDPYA